jgi:hypothetical protein
MKLTLFFNGQFWEGVVEMEHQGTFKAGRHLFGAEPSNIEVGLFILSNQAVWLIEQTNATLTCEPTEQTCTNPKRRARLAAREMVKRGTSTMAQMALQQELEQRKKVAKQDFKVEQEGKRTEKRRLMSQKAKARRRGKA